MLKKITALFAVALMVLSLAACSGDTTRMNKGTELTPTPFSDKIIAKEVAEKYEMTEVYKYEDKTYQTFKYEDKIVLARIEQSGNVRILFEYPLDTKITYDIEASDRSGNHLYFTKQDAGAHYASYCAIYLPTNTQFTVVDTPCSDMVLLDTHKNNELYGYGIIADASQIAVINLKEGSASTYSQTTKDISRFIDVGNVFFATGDFGSYTETTIEAIDNSHVMVNIIEKNSKGETKNETNFTFNPLTSVASF